MYTIKQAAARSGVNVPTIRAWERRYGVVHPERTASGYRVFDDGAITRLTAMRILVDDDGWRPSQAAEHVVRTDTDLDALVRRATSNPDEIDDPSGADGSEIRAVMDRFVTAAGLMDIPGMERALDSAFAAQRFELAVEQVVFPGMRAVGEAWASGRLDVAAEHAASETVRRRLSHQFDAAGWAESRPDIAVGMPPDGFHEIGVFAFAVSCRRAGLSVAYLGANVPVDSWLRVAGDPSVRALVLGVVTASDVAAAATLGSTLRDRGAHQVCLAGGPAVDRIPIDSGVRPLPGKLDDAVRLTRDLVRSGGLAVGRPGADRAR
jgi:MerR family transcriptional regulator, light-induced transcriptional regulator